MPIVVGNKDHHIQGDVQAERISYWLLRKVRDQSLSSELRLWLCVREKSCKTAGLACKEEWVRA